MTATCILCSTILISEPDSILDDQRTNRTFGALGSQFRKHLIQHHPKELQNALPPEDLSGTIIQLIQVMGITTQSAVLYSYLQSDDKDFQDRVNKMREMIGKSIEQKKPAPILVP